MVDTRALKDYAQSIGIAHLGVADASDFEGVSTLLAQQEADGTYPDFTERDIAARTRPSVLLPGAKSILSIAVSYLTDDPGHPHYRDAPRGLVSRYAWGDDYHPILKEKLDRIVAYLERAVGRSIAHRSYVDTGPLVDRAVAARAGIGWFGKNACLYVPGSGSWVFLGQVVTDVELAPDPAVSKSCGTCDKCMRACPTGAIERPFWVNPKKCLSYITQMPGWIPRKYRTLMGRHLWGCDICQVVCPWNWEAEPGADDAFRPGDAPGARPLLIPLLTMTKSEFRARFGKSAAAWRGKKTIQRNACICLGNIKDPAAIPALIHCLVSDPKPVIRGSAAWALGQIGGEEAGQALESALADEEHDEVREEIRLALADASRTSPRDYNPANGSTTKTIEKRPRKS